MIDLNNPRWATDLLPQNIKKYSDEQVMDFLTKNPLASSLIPEIKPEWIRHLVGKYPYVVSTLDNPPRDIQEIVISKNVRNAVYLRSIDDDLALACILKDPDFVNYAAVSEFIRNVDKIAK